MIYINAGEMCFLPMNVHNKLFNGVRQLRWRHISPVVSTFSTSIRLLSSFFIIALHPPFLSLYVHMSLSLSVVPHPVFLINGLPCGLEMLMFSSCNPKFFAVRHIHYPVNPSNVYCHTDAVVPSSDHCRTEIVLPPSDHYCIDSRFKIFIHSNQSCRGT